MKKNRAFTLVELMIVIVIIGIIIGVMIFHYFTAIDAAKTAKAKDEISTLCLAIGKYKSRHGKWPEQLVDLEYKGYLPKVPLDPWEGKYGIDLCFGLIGNFDTARQPPPNDDKWNQFLCTKRFKPKQFFFTNNTTTGNIEMYDVFGRKMKTIKLYKFDVQQSFNFGSFDVDEMDNIYVSDIGLTPHELRIFDRSGNEYENESIVLGAEDINDVEVGKSIGTGRPMMLKGRIHDYNDRPRLATHVYTLEGDNEVRLYVYDVDSWKMMSEVVQDDNVVITVDGIPVNYNRGHGYSSIADIVVSGDLYILSKNDPQISIYDQNASKRKRIVELESTSTNNRSLVILSNNYFVILESNKTVSLYLFDSSKPSGCRIIDSYSSMLTNPDKIAFDDAGFIYVKSGKNIEIIRFDEENETLFSYEGPMLKEQPVVYKDTLNDIRFSGLK